MIILVLNCGSSSLKFQLYDMVQGKPLAKGLVERIGMENGLLKLNVIDKEEFIIEYNFKDHNVAIKTVLDSLTEKGAVESLSKINGIGHRTVHGGEKFASSVVIDNQVLDYINDCVELAPLHNPPIILGIKACQELMPNVKQVAVFDTAFHQTIPPHGYLYGLPYELYEKHGIRKYGFHGTSHKYVAQRAASILNRPIEELKIITCHLGNGSSITAVKNGKSIETSMGLTPLAGLIMGTRSGDIDPGIIPLVMEKEKLNTEEMNEFLNKKCGVLGISGVSSDFRDIEGAAAVGNKRAQIALDLFTNGIKKYIGAYSAIMGGVDVIVFTAGVGENSPETRLAATKNLEFLGVEMDIEKNRVRGKEAIVSKLDSKVKILVIPTNEELMIAQETTNLIKN